MTAPLNGMTPGDRRFIKDGEREFGVYAMANRYVVVAPNGDTGMFDHNHAQHAQAIQQITFWIRRWANEHPPK